MSASVLPERLWYRDPLPPAWWSRRARFAYGLLILAIGWGGTRWANWRGDDAGHAISTMLLLTAGSVIAAAVLAPAWPPVARALMPVRRVAADLWRPVRSTIATAVGRAGRLAAAMWSAAASLVARFLAATAKLMAATWRPLSFVATTILAAIAHLIATAWPPVAATGGKALAAAGRLITAIVRPLATTIGMILSAIGHVPATAWRLVFSATRAALATFGRLIAAAWRPIRSSLARPVTATGHLIAIAWCAISSSTITTVATAGHLIARGWHPLGSAAGTILPSIGHVVGTIWQQVWTTLARAAAIAGRNIVATWATQGPRLARTVTPARAGMLVVELAVVWSALGFGYVCGWWLDGERVTGVVVEAPNPWYGPVAETTIRDPFTEGDAVVAVAFGLGARDVGDTAEAVVMASDPSKAATPATLKLYLALWGMLPLAALAWPIWWWRRCRHRWPQTWGMQAAGARS